MKLLTILTCLCFLSAPALAQSTPARIAVIDVNKVLMASTAGKKVYSDLKALQDKRIAEVTALQKEAEKAVAAKAAKAEIEAKQAAVKKAAAAADAELAEAKDKAMQALEAKIHPIIEKIGKEMGLAAIFNKFESGLVYASDAIDISDTVIKRFNEATK